MGMYKYMQKTWKSEATTVLMKARMIKWRKEETVVKMDRPTRLDRAHSLGYKAKQGFTIVRVKVGKGAGKRERKPRGRKPSKMGQYSMPSKMGKKRVAEVRAAKKHPNMEVLNAYYVAEDGQRFWFEVILVDPHHGGVKNNPKYNWVGKQSGRAYRGKTAAGQKARQLGRGRGFTHVRK